MKHVKKAGYMLAIIIMVIIKLPISIAAFIISNIEVLLVDMCWTLVYRLDIDCITEGADKATRRNINNCIINKEYFESLLFEDEEEA